MKILFLSQWFEPEPTFKGLQFARALVKRGHQVEVLTGFPNYPDGEIYPGYRIKPFFREIMHGVTVNRVPLFPSHDLSAVNRVANYASFSLAAATIGPFLTAKPDVIYAYHPPATVGLPALALKHRFRVPVVYDIQDMWPDTVAATGMLTNEYALKALGVWCQQIYKAMDRIVVLSPGFKKLLVGRGIAEEKIDVIYNWTHEAPSSSSVRDTSLEKSLGLAGYFNIIFAGNMGAAQGLTAVLDAASLLQKKYKKIQFVFIGGGVEREQLIAYAKANRISNAVFLERRTHEEIGVVLAAADGLLVHLVDDPLFKITIPSKIQAYLLAERPIIVGVKGDARDLVLNANAGLTCEPMSPPSIADTVVRLYKMPATKRQSLGRNGKDFYYREISLAVGISRFESVFQGVIAKKDKAAHSEHASSQS